MYTRALTCFRALISAQGEVSSLQAERDELLQKLAVTTKASSSARGGGKKGTAADDAGGGALLARMKARVAELEARIKENRFARFSGSTTKCRRYLTCRSAHSALRSRPGIVDKQPKYSTPDLQQLRICQVFTTRLQGYLFDPLHYPLVRSRVQKEGC